jgi:hypothetical protein
MKSVLIKHLNFSRHAYCWTNIYADMSYHISYPCDCLFGCLPEATLDLYKFWYRLLVCSCNVFCSDILQVYDYLYGHRLLVLHLFVEN